MSKLLIYENFHDRLQPSFGKKNIQCHQLNTDAFVLSINYSKVIKDLYLEESSDFRKLSENHEVFSNKNKKVNGKCKVKTPKNTRIDEFNCLKSRSKMYAFKGRDDSTNKFKGICKSQSKNFKIEDYKNMFRLK